MMNNFNYTRLQDDSGEIDGYKWLILDSGIITLAYVQIPPNHKLFHKEAWRDISSDEVENLKVNGGATYWAYTNNKSDPRYGCWLGWDYGHYYNANVELSKSEVMEDIKNAIKFIKEFEEE